MNKTANYQLSQWDAEDKVQRTDFNADNAKIDAALKAQADALAGKADSSTVSSLSSTVAGHTSTLSKKGNCRVYYTTYTGNGQTGNSHPNSLSFPQKPLLVVIFGQGSYMPMVYGASVSFGTSGGGTYASCSITWSGNTVSWYSSDARSQMNQGTFYVTALLEM